MAKSNVINLFPNKSVQSESNLDAAATEEVLLPVGHSVLDLAEFRKNRLREDRRRVKRTVLTEFVGASIVIPEKGLLKVRLRDLSEEGLAFDMEEGGGQFQVDEEVFFRIYLNHKTYFPFSVRVTNIQSFEENGVIRHGCIFMEESAKANKKDPLSFYSLHRKCL